MILITDELRARLLANGATDTETDHVPGGKTVRSDRACDLASHRTRRRRRHAVRPCDLGFGYPELGSVSLAELQSVKGRLGLGIERDLYFRTRFALSVYADAARIAGRITEDERLLRQAAVALSKPHSELPPNAAEPARR